MKPRPRTSGYVCPRCGFETTVLATYTDHLLRQHAFPPSWVPPKGEP